MLTEEIGHLGRREGKIVSANSPDVAAMLEQHANVGQPASR